MPWRPLLAYERGAMWAIASLHDLQATPATPLVAATFGEASPARVEEVAAAMALPDTSEVIQRFDQGRRCYIATVDGVIAAYGWVSQGVECIGELERPFHMADGEAYIWDCATLPPYRRKGLYAALLGAIVAALREEDVGRVWIGASLQNQPSVRGFATAGFQPVITLTYVRALGLRHVWIRDEPAAPPGLAAALRVALNGARR